MKTKKQLEKEIENIKQEDERKALENKVKKMKFNRTFLGKILVFFDNIFNAIFPKKPVKKQEKPVKKPSKSVEVFTDSKGAKEYFPNKEVNNFVNWEYP